MDKALANVFLEFYQNMLKPEFHAIRGKQAEHDERFDEIMKRFPPIHRKLDRLEDQLLTVNGTLNRLEEAVHVGQRETAGP